MYRVIISLLNNGRLKKRTVSGDSGTCNFTHLYNYSRASQLSLSCYVTAEVSGSKMTEDGLIIDIGDGSTVEGYYNAPLQSNVEYNVIVALVVQVEVNNI